MDSRKDHIIRSCVMDLHISEREKAAELQNRISAICHEQIIPRLSELCDELMNNSEFLLLDKLEIDVGAIKEHDLEEQLVNLTVKQFEEQVKKNIYALGFKPVIETSSSPVAVQENKLPGRTLTDLLIHFFRHGFIPWWNPYPGTDIREWITKQFNDDARGFITAMEKELPSPEVRFRVISYFSDRHFKNFFKASSLTGLFLFYESFKSLFYSDLYAVAGDWLQVRTTFFNTLLAGLYSVGSGSYSQPDISSAQKRKAVAAAVHQLVKEHSISKDLFNELVKRSEPGSSLFSENELNDIFSFPGMNRTTELVPEIKGKKKKDTEPKTDIDALSVAADLKYEAPGDITGKYIKDSFIEISNAGLVLLWPYLATLFDHLGYLKERIFCDKQARQRAVHLLNYISTGKEDGEEYEWVLNKLLCGFLHRDYVPAGIKLTGNEKEEAETMIRSAINNWKVLKNTSVEGLRNAFLLRKGIIKPDPYGWILNVERHGYDILLDKLPWPVSVVKLPWNKYIINVQW